MKCVFKTAAMAVIGGQNEFNDFYEYLVCEKNFPSHKARNAVSRRIAALALGVMKSNQGYKPYRERKNVDNKKTTT